MVCVTSLYPCNAVFTECVTTICYLWIYHHLATGRENYRNLKVLLQLPCIFHNGLCYFFVSLQCSLYKICNHNLLSVDLPPLGRWKIKYQKFKSFATATLHIPQWFVLLLCIPAMQSLQNV